MDQVPAVPVPTIQSSGDLLTVEEAAKFLRCSKHKLYGMTRARAGRDALPRIPFGKSLLFLRSDLVGYLLARRTTEAPALRLRRKAGRRVR